MASPSSPSAGGVWLALLPMIGAVIGLLVRQPTIGFLAGLAVGVAVALVIWWRGRG